MSDRRPGADQDDGDVLEEARDALTGVLAKIAQAIDQRRAGARRELASSAISALPVSDRTLKCLTACGYHTIGDVLGKSPREVLDASHVGRKSATELADALALTDPEFARGLRLEMQRPSSLSEKPADLRRKLMCVYFVRSGDFVKIGVAQSVSLRFAQLQTANPETLEVLATIDCSEGDDQAVIALELALHQRYANFRCRGEWFRYKGELKAYVESLRG